jgi:hypothetical protein
MCGTTCIVIGAIGLLLAIFRTLAAAISLQRMLRSDVTGVSSDFWIWMPTGILQDWLFPIAILLIGFALLSNGQESRNIQPPP